MNFGFLIEPPFNYRLDDGTVTGCDVELAKVILANLDNTTFVPIETSFAELLPGVVDGRWRMTTGLFVTDERRKTFEFSRPIWALSDGLLVRRENPLRLRGCRSIAENPKAQLAVIAGQVQHASALQLGVPASRIKVFKTYIEASGALILGAVDAYASVARAHAGYLGRYPNVDLDIVAVPSSERKPSFGAFAFDKNDLGLIQSIDCALNDFLGSTTHRRMMARFGFSDEEVDVVGK